jgi:hypothetical protein
MFGRKNKVGLLQLLNAIECYPLGSWGAGDDSSMAKLVVCAHLMGREYGMDVQLIKQLVVDALGGCWKISKLPNLHEALNILGLGMDWYNDYNKVQMWRESHQYEILSLENMIKSL